MEAAGTPAGAAGRAAARAAAGRPRPAAASGAPSRPRRPIDYPGCSTPLTARLCSMNTMTNLTWQHKTHIL